MSRLILILCTAMLTAGCASAVDYGPDKPLKPTPTSSGNGRAGFIALQGTAAAEFVVRADVRLISASNLKARELISLRFQQFVEDAEVFGGQFTVLCSAVGDVIEVFGAYFPELQSTNKVKLDANAAQGVAAAKIGGDGNWSTQLMINPQNGRYFYEVENQRFDSRWFYSIDAENGSIIDAYDGLTTSEGVGVLGDTKNLGGLTTPNGNSFEMKSANGRQTTYDSQGKIDKGVLAIDDNDTWNTRGRASPGQGALVDAHFYAFVVDKYLKDTFQFDWVKHYRQGMVSSAHFQYPPGLSQNNASWNGTQMFYGNGDGSKIIELSAGLDVVGHELSHGVTEATSKLIYKGESGALNEAFSDIMGTSIEFWYGPGDWTIGEDVTLDGKGIRNMADPQSQNYPSHYADRYTGTRDNGGVHSNSGIINHWYYLLVNGGQNANSARASGKNVQGIGKWAATQIVFLGFTHLSQSADFCAARAGTIAFAGENKANAADAWDEVGVDDALCSDKITGPGPGQTARIVTTAGGCVVTSNDTNSIRECCDAEGKRALARCRKNASASICEQEEISAYNACLLTPEFRNLGPDNSYTERAPEPLKPSSPTSAGAPVGMSEKPPFELH